MKLPAHAAGFGPLLLLVLLLAWPGPLAAHEGPHGNPAFAPVRDDPALPRVLLLGDSISIGYTPYVRQLLDGKANVHRPAENCGPTTRGLERLDHWLGETSWDVIHFNFGLHDLKYINDQGEPVAPDQGQMQVPPPAYERNLRQLVTRLRATGATLIWCTTTPVPPGAQGRVAGDADRYNHIAAKVMREVLGDDRVVNDLFSLARSQLAEIQQPANVHFTAEGSRQLAQQVASVIEQHLPPSSGPMQQAQGIVYEDRNENQRFDEGDRPLPDIRVSNGRQIVTTDPQGRYSFPVDNDTILFVIKPRGFRTPLDENQLPQFYYVHKPEGSPSLRFAGVSPTGPLPESIDFPLYAQQEPDQFKAIMFGDPQPRNQQEVDYMAHDVVAELIGTDASFGVTLGDITFDNLDLFLPQARVIAMLGIPWYNVIGNHDINYDARRDHHSDETFERVFGPPYYSFDYGPVHFLVLDDVEWLIDENGKGRYQGGLGKRQMEFIRNDLAEIPEDQLVVLMMHIPLVNVRDRHDLYRLIEKRPFSMSISAHQHYHEHRYITREDGWQGPEPHHHVINVTVSGSWWSGLPGERGVPHTMMADGAPNGYSIVSFDGHRYRFDFKAAGRSPDFQMQIYAPDQVEASQLASTSVYANVFNGSERWQVQLQIADRPPIEMQRVLEEDPRYQAIYQLEQALRKSYKPPQDGSAPAWVGLPRPHKSAHLWRVNLPADLPTGTHLMKVTATGPQGQTFQDKRLIRVP